MAVHELCTAQERLAGIHSIIYEDIHPCINQALAGLDEALASQQLYMDEDTHQEYLKACKRAHTLEESIKPPLSPFLLQKEDIVPSKRRKRMTNHHLLISEMTLSRYYLRQQKP